MTHETIFETVERHAFDARLLMSEVCRQAGISHAAWSGAKKRGKIGVKLLRKMETAMTELRDAK